MAPRSEAPKAKYTKEHQSINKANPTKGKASPAGVSKNTTNAKIPTKVNTIDKRQQTSSVPKVSTQHVDKKVFLVNTIDKRQETSSVPKVSTKNVDKKIGSVTKSVRQQLWKRKPAHSGVPLTEKMKKLKKRLQDPDCSL